MTRAGRAQHQHTLPTTTATWLLVPLPDSSSQVLVLSQGQLWVASRVLTGSRHSQQHPALSRPAPAPLPHSPGVPGTQTPLRPPAQGPHRPCTALSTQQLLLTAASFLYPVLTPAVLRPSRNITSHYFNWENFLYLVKLESQMLGRQKSQPRREEQSKSRSLVSRVI